MATLVTDPDLLAGFLSDQSGLQGHAAGLVRPRDAQDVAEFVSESYQLKRPILAVGRQTATTGAAVPMGDVVLSLAGMAGIVDIDRERRLAEVLPGTLTIDLKQAVAAEGLLYPPDPTSERECSIGGNIATNASGARTFRYGMTARWVEGIEVVTGRGELLRLSRRELDKNTAGYLPFLDPVAPFLGSEGTLGVVTRVWLRLIPDPGPFIAAIVYLPTLAHALQLAVAYRTGQLTPVPNCVELFDRESLTIIAGHRRPPPRPSQAQAALYLEFDSLGEPLERVLERTIVPLAAHGVLVDETVVAATASEVDWIRDLRHLVPEWGNLEAARWHAAGGLKVSTEFCLPISRLPEMMELVDRTAQEAGIDLLVRYGHIGNGHPHIFMRGRDRAETDALRELALVWYRRAVALGGTVSGEHGIGKTRLAILPLMHSRELIAAMRGLKQAYDPAGILAPGNIFPA